MVIDSKVKGALWLSKGHLLHVKRRPFTMQKGVFYNAKEHLLFSVI